MLAALRRSTDLPPADRHRDGGTGRPRRCRATRDTISARLGDHGLIRRYGYDDGLGDPDRGEELLGRVLATSNDFGLLAEEADAATDEPLGNFPQGLTHLGDRRRHPP